MISISQPALRDQHDVSVARTGRRTLRRNLYRQAVNNVNSADIRARLFNADGPPGSISTIAVRPGRDLRLRCCGIGRWRVCGDLDAAPGRRFRYPDERPQRRRQRPACGRRRQRQPAHNAFGTVAGLAGGGFVVQRGSNLNEVRLPPLRCQRKRAGRNRRARHADRPRAAVSTQMSRWRACRTAVSSSPIRTATGAPATGDHGARLQPERHAAKRVAPCQRLRQRRLSETLAREPTLTVLPNGYFVVGWIDGHAAQHLQAYDALGNALGRNAIVATQVRPARSTALHGGLIADVWGRCRHGRPIDPQPGARARPHDHGQ